MSGHILVVVDGFGKRVIPSRAPYSFHVDAAGTLRLSVHGRGVAALRAEEAADGVGPGQRHAIVPLGATMLVVTLQCRADRLALVEETHRLLAESALTGEQ